MNFIDGVRAVWDFVSGLGSTLLLPLIITIIGLIFGQKLRTALRAGLMLAVGFITINLVIGLLIGEMVPVVNAMVEGTGANLTILDVGWGVAAGIAWGTQAGSLVVIVCLLTNIIMLALKLTKTLNIDIWNFWNQAFTASVVYLASGRNMALAMVAAAIHTVYALKIADATAKDVQEFYNLPGISIPHGWAVSSVPIIYAVNWVLDRIPGVKDIHWDESGIREKWGIFGEPLFLGVLLGVLVGLFGGLWRDPVRLLTLGVTIGAAMVLIPKIIGFFMEAGPPITVAAGIIMIPIVLGLALILPGNKVLPFGDLAATFYFVAMVPFMSKGNLFRSIVCGTVIFVVVLYACTSFGPALTEMALETGYAIPEGAVDITGLSAGNWLSALLFQIGRLFGG